MSLLDLWLGDGGLEGSHILRGKLDLLRLVHLSERHRGLLLSLQALKDRILLGGRLFLRQDLERLSDWLLDLLRRQLSELLSGGLGSLLLRQLEDLLVAGRLRVSLDSLLHVLEKTELLLEVLLLLLSRNRVVFVSNLWLGHRLRLGDLLLNLEILRLAGLLHGASASQPLEFLVKPIVGPVELLRTGICGLLRLPHVWLVIIQFLGGTSSVLELVHAVPVSLLDLSVKVLGRHVERGLVVEVCIDRLLADVGQFGNDVLQVLIVVERGRLDEDRLVGVIGDLDLRHRESILLGVHDHEREIIVKSEVQRLNAIAVHLQLHQLGIELSKLRIGSDDLDVGCIGEVLEDILADDFGPLFTEGGGETEEFECGHKLHL